MRLPLASRRLFLTFAGPTLMVVIVRAWVALLLIGFALIAWPALGEQIKKASGPTPTDFATALYYSGYTLATLGYGDLVPQSALYRLLAVVEALLGFAVLTLSLTYLSAVYSALIRRNTLALALHHGSAGTDDAAELLARLASEGDFRSAIGQIASLNLRLHDLYESHHSYLTLHYFHFRKPLSAMAHLVGMTADLATLALTALEPSQARGVTDAAAITEAYEASVDTLRRLSDVFLPRSFPPQQPGHMDVAQRRRWRERFERSLGRLAKSAAATVSDRRAAGDRYVQSRQAWDPYVQAFRRYMLESAAGADRTARP